ncbi:diacylglycerol kinase family protein [Oscillatoria sp. CS-180]|uniref:diacylglycerol kinase family protein n=1 Tax=Oscillatoria sp. CS-180 TaxID=3021720 RepID=UPI00232F1ABC|nr:diacylglycerol kinase family protein [Oscillatoria sp. CS-180]MDB9526232.1 diacylglycerol kinase family protein [Oscillatoria sp. CS-180]
MPTPSSISNPAPITNGSESSSALERSDAFKVAHNLGSSFLYAGQGIYYALRTQRNFRIHAVASILVISLGVVLKLSNVHIAVLGLTCGAVMALELINTALEAVVDLTVKQTYHELAKIAKDCAAAAVFVAALTAILVGVCLIAPPLLEVLAAYFSN